MSNLRDEALHVHRVNKGKLATHSKVPIKNAKDLSLAYSPGVAEPCKEIYDHKESVYDYTMKGNMVAVVSDGSAVLGLGKLPCLSWKGKLHCSKVLLVLMLSRSVWTRIKWMKL